MKGYKNSCQYFIQPITISILPKSIEIIQQIIENYLFATMFFCQVLTLNSHKKEFEMEYMNEIWLI